MELENLLSLRRPLLLLCQVSRRPSLDLGYAYLNYSSNAGDTLLVWMKTCCAVFVAVATIFERGFRNQL
jgi:hypothetical protein